MHRFPRREILILSVLSIAMLAASEAIAQPRSKQKLPGGVPDWTGEVTWDNRPPVFSKAMRELKTAVPWMQAVHDTNARPPALVECDWVKLWARTPAGDRLLHEETYADGRAEGGLFRRDPFFGDDTREPMPYEVRDGVLRIKPYEHADKVYHWWPRVRTPVPEDATVIWAEARVRVSGSGAVETGLDFYESPDCPVQPKVTHAEGARGRWHFKSNDWQILTAGKPPSPPKPLQPGRSTR